MGIKFALTRIAVAEYGTGAEQLDSLGLACFERFLPVRFEPFSLDRIHTKAAVPVTRTD